MNRIIEKSSRAFTLIELLVVIAIIGILVAVLLGTFSGGSESARTALCLSNMRNLATACQSAGVEIYHYPPASSVETLQITMSGGQALKIYREVRGWISWDSRSSQYGNKNGSASHHNNPSISMYSTDKEAQRFALTNGVLWKYTSGNQSVYQCPQHVKTMKQLEPAWSYVMNGYFGWDRKRGNGPYPYDDWPGISYGSLKKADRILLFSEIQFVTNKKLLPNVTVPEETSGETTDSILQYPGCTGGGNNEVIGFNHKSNRKRYCANVVFADGHTEKLLYPEEGGTSQLQDLTQWLCTGVDVSFDGNQYEKFNN